MEFISWWRLARFAFFVTRTSSLVTATQAATYYVSPSGSDANSGTLTAPFVTLQKAVNLANPGDTIYMRGGTYALSGQVNINRDGTSGNPIRVFNYPGEVPILDAASATNSAVELIRMLDASWWHFKGLEIKNSPKLGLVMWDGSHNNIIENCNIHHNGRLATIGSGILVTGTSSNT